MEIIDRLEAYRDHPMRVGIRGDVVTLPHPRQMHPDEILLVLYANTFRELPADVPFWKYAEVVKAWCAHHDLPGFEQARRLLYLVQRYRDEIEYDLQDHLGVRFDELFRNREWRRLLNLIDRLPRNSWYTEAVSNDEEHAEMLARSLAERAEEQGSSHPPMRMWTQEAALLAQVIDGVRGLGHIIRAVNGDKTSKQPPPTPVPTTALEKALKRASHESKKAKHEALVARMLPHKARRSD